MHLFVPLLYVRVHGVFRWWITAADWDECERRATREEELAACVEGGGNIF